MIGGSFFGIGESCEIQVFNPGGGLRKNDVSFGQTSRKTMFLSVRTSKNDVSFGHPPGLKTWISHHQLGQIVLCVVPSSSARIGVCIQLSLAIPVQRRKMTGTSHGLRQLAVPLP